MNNSMEDQSVTVAKINSATQFVLDGIGRDTLGTVYAKAYEGALAYLLSQWGSGNDAILDFSSTPIRKIEEGIKDADESIRRKD